MDHSLSLLEKDVSLSSHARFLKKHGLYSAALYYKNLNETLERRAARAGRYALEHVDLPDYTDGQPFALSCGWDVFRLVEQDDPHRYGLRFQADGECSFDEAAFRRLYEKCENSVERYVVDSVIVNCRAMFSGINHCRYDHGGIHNVVDFDFILNHGISAYRPRMEQIRNTAADPKKRMFAEAMLDMLEGTECYVRRYTIHLEALLESYSGDRETLGRLIRALKKVPLQKAESFYEAYVSCSMAMGLAACFEPGRLDQYLWPFYEKDLADGKTSRAEALSLISAMFADIDRKTGHPGVTHATVGGTDREGKPAYNELTELCILAIRGHRTPNVTLRVRQDMPDALWDLFLENMRMGCGQPAIVNEDLFLQKLTQDYAIPYADAVNYVFGGCSEVLIQGKTMCDSTWVQYNMLDIFENTLYNHFPECNSFEEFYRIYKEEIALTLRDLEQQINCRQLAMGNNNPLLMKSLLAEGCLENGRSFTAGGCVYNFDSTNLYASTNAINSLYTLRQFYDGRLGDISREDLLQALISDFEGREPLLAKCRNVTKFGNYDPQLNALARDLMCFTFDRVMELRCWRGNEGYTGRYMPTIVLWVDWISSGRRVGATPDGRLLGEATAASCGPMPGTDTEGPTSVMGAALSLDQGKCAGTCVLNLRLDPSNFRSPEMTAKVRRLIEVYFRQGGSQLQINVVDPQALLDALEHPEQHRDIIVRVGGFSDNFVMLDKAMQQEIVKRTQHTV